MTRVAAPCLVAFVGSAWILAAHFDRSWWPPDEGQFAHVAERMLEGDLLHREIRDPHTDYGHWLNAAALAAWHSKARGAKGKVEVHQCLARDVRKPRGYEPGKVQIRNWSSIKVYVRDPDERER